MHFVDTGYIPFCDAAESLSVRFIQQNIIGSTLEDEKGALSGSISKNQTIKTLYRLFYPWRYSIIQSVQDTIDSMFGLGYSRMSRPIKVIYWASSSSFNTITLLYNIL